MTIDEWFLLKRSKTMVRFLRGNVNRHDYIFRSSRNLRVTRTKHYTQRRVT